MANFCGSHLRLQVKLGDVWTLVQTKSDGGSLSNEQVDVTDKSGMPWRHLLECGLRSVTLTSSGFTTDTATFEYLQSQAANDPVVQARLFDPTGIFYQGKYLISSFGRSGEHNGAEEFNMTLESMENVGNVTPLFDAFPLGPGNNWGWGWSVQILREAYTGFPLQAYRESDGAVMDIPFDSSGYTDLVILANFLQGSVGRVSILYNQGPTGGTFPNGTPAPTNDLDQNADINAMLWLTDQSGNIFTSSAGVLELGGVWEDGLPGTSRGFHASGANINFGNPAGNPDLSLMAVIGRRRSQAPQVFNHAGLLDIGSNGWEIETGEGDPEAFADLEYDADGTSVVITQPNNQVPFIMSGYSSNTVVNTAIYNDGTPVTTDIVPQGGGIMQTFFGKQNSNQHGFNGWLQEGWFYFEDPTYLDSDLVRAMQRNQMQGLGIPL